MLGTSMASRYSVASSTTCAQMSQMQAHMGVTQRSAMRSHCDGVEAHGLLARVAPAGQVEDALAQRELDEREGAGERERVARLHRVLHPRLAARHVQVPAVIHQHIVLRAAGEEQIGGQPHQPVDGGAQEQRCRHHAPHAPLAGRGHLRKDGVHVVVAHVGGHHDGQRFEDVAQRRVGIRQPVDGPDAAGEQAVGDQRERDGDEEEREAHRERGGELEGVHAAARARAVS